MQFHQDDESAAKDIMTEVALQWSKDTITEDDLYEERDRLMVARGFDIPKIGAGRGRNRPSQMRRPAAAPKKMRRPAAAPAELAKTSDEDDDDDEEGEEEPPFPDNFEPRSPDTEGEEELEQAPQGDGHAAQAPQGDGQAARQAPQGDGQAALQAPQGDGEAARQAPQDDGEAARQPQWLVAAVNRNWDEMTRELYRPPPTPVWETPVWE